MICDQFYISDQGFTSLWRDFCKSCFCYPTQIPNLKMDVKNEQRSTMKFCCWLKKSAVETMKLMHESYTNEERLKDSTTYYRHKAFSKGRETVPLLPYVGQLLSICTEEIMNTVTAVVWEDCYITVRQLAQASDISKPSVYMVLCEKIKMWRVAVWSVPYFLIREQRDHHIEICRKWLKRIEDELDVMVCVITGDEG